jgi:hypothetical protein
MLGRTVVVVLLLAALPRIAAGEATVDLSWNDCSPIVAATSADPDHPVSTLYVSARGWTEPHEGYVVRLWIGADLPCEGLATSTPDAWRFDADGCNAGKVATFLAFASKTCPSVAGAIGGDWNGHFLAYTSGSDPYSPQGSMRFVMLRSYPTVVPDPATRYLLVGIRFDHSSSTTGAGTPGVSCGGLETPICVALWPDQEHIHGGPGCQPDSENRDVTSYLRSSDNAQVRFVHGQGWASVNVNGSFGCFQATPARDATWGSIKDQYR